MLELATCILEVIVLLLVVKVLWSVMPRGTYISDPSIGAAIGNAANRNFENTQTQVIGMSDRGFMCGGGCGAAVGSQINNRVWPQPGRGITGYMSPPETLIWTNGGHATR